jgi:hypothetical protein
MQRTAIFLTGLRLLLHGASCNQLDAVFGPGGGFFDFVPGPGISVSDEHGTHTDASFIIVPALPKGLPGPIVDAIYRTGLMRSRTGAESSL